jgi:hypothetical protein
VDAKEKKVQEQLMKLEEGFFTKVGIDPADAEENVKRNATQRDADEATR